MSNSPALRFRFRQIGPIRDAEVELGRLTVIAGRNNTGKTYLLNALYGFVVMWRQIEAMRRSFCEDPALAAAMAFLRDAAESGYAHRKVSLAVFHKERMILLDAMSAAYSGALDRIFSAPAGSFRGGSVRADLDEPRKNSLIAQGFERRSDNESTYVIRSESDGIALERIEGIQIETYGAPDETSVGPEQPDSNASGSNATLENLMRLYVVFAFPELRLGMHGYPAESAAVTLFQPDVDFNRNRIVELLRDFDLPPQEREVAASSFLRKATSRYGLLVRDSIDSARNLAATKQAYDPVLRDAVPRMMDGEYETDGNQVFFRSRQGAEHDFRIPLPMASTSVRSLAGLYHAALTEGFNENLVLIDEPEASLDTTNQVRLARVLARLVRSGVRILIATHSDYLIKELNNLIMLSRSFEDKKAVIENLGYLQDDSLPADAVCAFVAENGGLTRCEVDIHGMNMPIFDETIDSINNAANLLAARVVR